ncbi:superoxide dismutase (Fe), partial [Reticulomyxa filosa]
LNLYGTEELHLVKLHQLTTSYFIVFSYFPFIDIVLLELSILNLASQIYNHDFFWKCLTPEPKHRDRIPNYLITSLTTYFGLVEQFKQAFATSATNHFGSEWFVYVRLCYIHIYIYMYMYAFFIGMGIYIERLWLTWNKKEGKLQLFEGHDAENSLQHELVPLLTTKMKEQNLLTNFGILSTGPLLLPIYALQPKGLKKELYNFFFFFDGRL